MLALNIYNTAITKNNYATGQAKAVLFFIILFLFAQKQIMGGLVDGAIKS